MSREIIRNHAFLAGMSGALLFCTVLGGCSRLKHVEPENFKFQLENVQSMYGSYYIGQADGRAYLLSRRMPLIGKRGKEEVLYTEASQLGEDFLNMLEQRKNVEAGGAKTKPGSAALTGTLNIIAMQAMGQVTITASQHDRGSVTDIFDNDADSLWRSAGVNPCFIQMAFARPQTIRQSRVICSHTPSHRWQLECADTQADMDARTGTWKLLVGWNDAIEGKPSSARFAQPQTAQIFKLMVQRMQTDNFVHLNEWQLVGDVEEGPQVQSPGQ